MYTVAGNQAAALNKLSNINFLPLGIIAKEDGKVMRNDAAVNVEISANRYVTDKLFVFDAKMGTFTPADAPISIMANEHGRYYITTASSLPGEDAVISEVKIFSPCAGKLTATAANSMISTLYIYSLNGQLVTSRHNIAASNATLTLPHGLYVVTVETESGSKATQKLIVK